MKIDSDDNEYCPLPMPRMTKPLRTMFAIVLLQQNGGRAIYTEIVRLPAQSSPDRKGAKNNTKQKLQKGSLRPKQVIVTSQSPSTNSAVRANVNTGTSTNMVLQCSERENICWYQVYNGSYLRNVSKHKLSAV